MNTVEFSWLTALIGGSIIGLAAVVMMASVGRVTGISGIFANILKPRTASLWQLAFILGLISSGIIMHQFVAPINLQIESSKTLLVVAGLLVGFGTRLGNGCTSGHGVCGLSLFSYRSLVATVTFIGCGMLTVFLLRTLF